MNCAVFESEKRVVAAHTYIFTGVDFCAALTNEDVAGKYILTVSSLYAEALGLAVAAVLGGTHTFFMCHLVYTSRFKLSVELD